MTRSFKLAVDLQLPPGSKGKKLAAGSKVSEVDLDGLNVDGLLAGGYLVEEPVDEVCPACAEAAPGKGTAESRKKTYNLQELREHYAKEHPALAAPAE